MNKIIYLLAVVFINSSDKQIHDKSISCQSADFYKSAYDYIEKDLRQKKLITGTGEISIDKQLIPFQLGAFSKIFTPKTIEDRTKEKGKAYSYDSLSEISDRFNSDCAITATDSLIFNHRNRSGNKPKYVLFFSKYCHGKLQAELFGYSDNLKPEDYLKDFYGISYLYLFEFQNGKITKTLFDKVHNN